MKLFDDFEAVMFPEEKMIYITYCEYLYYIYDSKYKYWTKHRNAGNDHITVANYPDVSKKALRNAMQGTFPKKETDFMRLCKPSRLWIRDMLDLLREDYPKYMESSIYRTVHRFLLESNIRHKSFLELKKLLDNAISHNQSHSQVTKQIEELSYSIIGRDIFKKEIRIVDGHDGSSYFWIKPVRVIDYSDTNDFDNVAEMRSAEISIEEDDVSEYLTPFLYKHYDDELEVNKKRMDCGCGFEWYLTHNFFTFDSVLEILKDINDTVDALSFGRENEFTAKLNIKKGTAANEPLYAKDLSEEQSKEYDAGRPTEDISEVELIIDFYRRFIYRMEYMLKVGKENGYDLISFMGP